MSIGELGCTYACLILSDDGIPITSEKIATILKAANVNVESYWPSLFTKHAEKRSIDDLVMNVGAGGGGGAVAVTAPAKAPVEEKKFCLMKMKLSRERDLFAMTAKKFSRDLAKVKVGNSYQSCCVVVKNMQRCVYAIPNSSVFQNDTVTKLEKDVEESKILYLHNKFLSFLWVLLLVTLFTAVACIYLSVCNLVTSTMEDFLIITQQHSERTGDSREKVEPVTSSDYSDIITQLMKRLEELEAFKKEQLRKTEHVEKTLELFCRGHFALNPSELLNMC